MEKDIIYYGYSEFYIKEIEVIFEVVTFNYDEI